MQTEIINAFATMLLIVLVLVTTVVCAGSIVVNGMRHTCRKLIFWIIVGVVCSLVAVSAVVLAGKMYGMSLQNVTPSNCIEATANLAIAFSCLFFLTEEIKTEQKR